MQKLLVQRTPQIIGEHFHHTRCRFCYSDALEMVIDFGNVALAGGFLKKGSTQEDFDKERRYPLQIAFCKDCYLVQVNNVIDASVLFKDYFYFSSAIKTLVDHFANYAKELKVIYPDAPKRLVVEIGSNDGVFMRPLMAEGFKVVGVDPADNVVKPLAEEKLTVVNDFFTEKVAKDIAKIYGKADVMVSSNSFAHIDDMHEVVRGIKHVLKADGFFAFEVHYLGTLINEVQYDMMYHEHQSYYSLLTLSNFFAMYDMEVFDVKPIPIHAGSMRYYVQHRGEKARPISKAATALRKSEKAMGLDKLETFIAFDTYIKQTRKDLLRLLNKLKKQGKTIAGYGASGRATAIMSFCGIDERYLDYVVDDAPAKQGAFTPGNHLPIRSSEILDDPKKRPDYCLMFAWSFINEIKKKKVEYLASGGAFIVPLPSVKVVKK